jgi:dolichyl-phosphate-mannose-protein mannosyltransferase
VTAIWDSGRLTRLGGATALAVIALFFNLLYIAAAPAGPEEEHFRLGRHLYATGVLSIDDDPSIFRPPGFPVFVAVVLRLRDVVAPGLDDEHAVALAQGVLLSLAALALFLHSSRFLPVPVALAAGLLYAFNPLNLLIARVLNYYTLHITLLTLGVIALSSGLRSRRTVAWALGGGVLWGLATLVRPVSLVLPPFVLLLARWQGGRGSWRRALLFACVFALGMAAVISPYTVRNYRLTHRLIVVNAQDGYALWGLSATRNPFGDIPEWSRLWKYEGGQLFERVAGAPYCIEVLYQHELALNDAFRAEAGRNIRAHPWRFATSVIGNFVAFNLDSSHRWLDSLAQVRNEWDLPFRAPMAKAFSIALLLLGVVGVVRALNEGETDARVVIAVYVMFLIAHSMVVLMSRYTYVRLPLLLFAIPHALRGVEKSGIGTRALLVAVVFATLSVWELSFR